MNRRERFCWLYDFEPVDRPVRWEAVEFWGETVEEWVRAGHLQPGENPHTHFECDPRLTLSAGLGFTSFSLSGRPIESRVVEEAGAAVIVEDDLGNRRRERTDGVSMPQFLRFAVENHQDWVTKIKPRLKPEDHPYDNLDELASQSQCAPDPWGLWLLGLYAFWRNYWGEENLAFAFYDYPATLHDMAECWLELHLQCLPRVFASAHLDYTMFHEDMAFKNGPLIGPRLFADFMQPYYHELFRFLRARGQTRFMLDSDGNLGPLLDHFVELGFNGLFPFEIAAGYDVREVRRRYPRFFIWGGIDKRVLNDSRAGIEREIKSKVPEVWASGGFIPSLDHSCPPCPYDNFVYYLETLRGVCA